MKINVIGFESSEGVSKKTGQPYAIGKLYAALPLAGSKGTKGYMGSEYRCEPSVLKKIEHNAPPFMAEVEFQDVMRFGERQQQIVSIVPTASEVKPAGTAVRPA
ncbi:CTX phage RstB protein [Variovorax sp. OK605]|uniref:hypothetical protein n=1 Tax=Variovorax sp. OK605 TaxID=1855317 RepID=UPI0008ED94E4|nr:hypothetical protein [Variovorax sp. OK605]SFQ68824.1 CTX phage RstB protein [Variovorax sp. OK605]